MVIRSEAWLPWFHPSGDNSSDPSCYVSLPLSTLVSEHARGNERSHHTFPKQFPEKLTYNLHF